MAKVRLSGPLKILADNSDEIDIKASDVKGLIENISIRFPEVRDKLYESEETFSKFINVFVNGENVDLLNGKKNTLKDTDVVCIITPIAGG